MQMRVGSLNNALSNQDNSFTSGAQAKPNAGTQRGEKMQTQNNSISQASSPINPSSDLNIQGTAPQSSTNSGGFNKKSHAKYK